MTTDRTGAGAALKSADRRRRAADDLDFGFWLVRRRLSSRTIAHYGRSVERIEQWLKQNRRRTLRVATWKDIRDYAETLPYTYASRSALQSAIKAYWTYLARKDCPAWAAMTPKKPRMIPRPLSRDELNRVLATARSMSPTVYALVCCLYYLAFRREDAAKLRWDQIKDDGRLHVVGKGGVEAYLPIRTEVREALERLVREEEDEFVFPGRWGGHMALGTVNHLVTVLAEVAGVNFTAHVLRHTAITNAYRGTKDMFATQEFARHADARTTKGYTQVDWKQIEAAADAL